MIPKDRVDFVIFNGEKVISKDTTVSLIRKHRGIFAGADEIIDH